jgi:hypothetical protein
VGRVWECFIRTIDQGDVSAGHDDTGLASPITYGEIAVGDTVKGLGTVLTGMIGSVSC